MTDYTQAELETLRDKWTDIKLEAARRDDDMSMEQANKKLTKINNRLNN